MHVAACLLNDGHKVVVLDDLSGGASENVPPGATFVRGSITDEEQVRRLFAAEQFEYVYHLAAYAAEGLSHFIRRFNYTNNLIGSVNLINQSILHQVKCFVFTSSIAVYGTGQTPMMEEMTPRPEDPYGVAKYAVELDLRLAREQFGLNYIAFRPHNVYGEGQNLGDRYRNVIGIFMNKIMQGQPMTIFGDGTQTRAFTYIDDVASVIARSVQNEAAYGEIFNLGGDHPYTINELAHAVARAMGVEPQITYLRARNEVLHAVANHDKVRRYFETPPPTSLHVGLAKMAAWAHQVGSRKTPLFTQIEIPTGLPEGWAE
jgi:UDP-glucose 4-epimerase